MPTADPISATTSIPDDVFDPMLAAVRGILVDAVELPELKAQNVAILSAEKTAADINQEIMATTGKTGLCAIIIPGAGKNSAPELEQPRFTIQFDLQLYTRRAVNHGRKAAQLVVEIIRKLHATEIQVTGVPWQERIAVISFTPMPDPDFVAHSITFEREIQF